MTLTTTTLRVRDLMTDRILTVRPEDPVGKALDLMLDHHIRHVPVVGNEGDLEGLVSHRDLLRCALIEQSETPTFVQKAILQGMRIGEVMTRDVDTVEPDLPLRQAASLMFENKYGCLPVVTGELLVGILTEADFVRWVARLE